MDTTEITHLSLCSGYGGIDLGLKGVFGENVRTVAYAEIEAFAIECLLARMEGGQLDAAPIWPNLKSFPWQAFSDRVDILSGGYPCQPFSAAGKRLGTDDPRHLWPFIADGIRIMRPKLCFFENVEGHISLGLREVIEELGSIGYKTTWGIFSAREVGAPHQRKRVFILAYSTSLGIQGHWADWLQKSRSHDGQTLPVRGGEGCELADTSDGSDPASGHAETHRLPSKYREEVCSWKFGGADADAWPSRPSKPQHAWEPPRVVDDSKHDGFTPSQVSGSIDETTLQQPKGKDNSFQSAGTNNDATAKSFSVGNTRDKGYTGAKGESRAREEGESNGYASESINDERRQTQSSLGRDADGTAGGLDYAKLCVTCDNRTDELRLLGNGVVPATATRAFLTLMEELNE